MRKHQLAILASFVSSLCIAWAQEPPPVSFKVEVNLVEVGAVVTDAQGRFVNTLGRDDFQILEDGRPQKVAGFSLVNLPVQGLRPSTPDSKPVEPDVSTNAGGLQGWLCGGHHNRWSGIQVR